MAPPVPGTFGGGGGYVEAEGSAAFAGRYPTGVWPETGMGVTAIRPSRRRHGDILWKFLDSEAAAQSARMTDCRRICRSDEQLVVFRVYPDVILLTLSALLVLSHVTYCFCF